MQGYLKHSLQVFHRRKVKEPFFRLFIVLLLSQKSSAQCPDVTEAQTTLDGGNCYILNISASSWQEADDHCRNEYGGALVQVKTQSQLEIAAEFLNDDVAALWIGGREYFTDWKWTDDSAVTYTNWISTERAQYYTPREVCGAIDASRSFEWSKFACGIMFQYICEVAATDPYCGPGETNRTYVVHGNKCFVEMGTSTSNNYKNWFNARDHCIEIGGAIAMIDSASAQSAVESILEASRLSYWIGLRQTTYYWSTGEKISNNFWQVNEPSLRSGLACIVLIRRLVEVEDEFIYQFVWTTANCEDQHAFICQIGSDTATQLVIPTAEPIRDPNNPDNTPPRTRDAVGTTSRTPPTTTTHNNGNGNNNNNNNNNGGGNNVEDENSSGDPATTAGLIVALIIVFAVLGGLVAVFCFYTRRNRQIKKQMRANAEMLENGDGYRQMSRHSLPNQEEPDLTRMDSMRETDYAVFTTSLTSSQRAREHQRRQNARYKANGSTPRSGKNVDAREEESPTPVEPSRASSTRYKKNEHGTERVHRSREHRTRAGAEHSADGKRSPKTDSSGDELNKSGGIKKNSGESDSSNSESKLPPLGSSLRANALPPLNPQYARSSTRKHKKTHKEVGTEIPGEENGEFKRHHSGRRSSQRSKSDLPPLNSLSDSQNSERKKHRRRDTDIDSTKHSRDEIEVEIKRKSSIRKQKQGDSEDCIGEEKYDSTEKSRKRHEKLMDGMDDTSQSDRQSQRRRKRSEGSKRAQSRRQSSIDASDRTHTQSDSLHQNGDLVTSSPLQNDPRDSETPDVTHSIHDTTEEKSKPNFDVTLALETYRSAEGVLDDPIYDGALDKSLGDAASLPDDDEVAPTEGKVNLGFSEC